MEDVVRRARDGDKTAFEQLYRDNVGRVYALCIRLTADRALAEDLTQDVFIRTWEKLGSFRGESKFSSWIHRLAVNVALTHCRGEARRAAREQKVASESVLTTSSDPISGRLDVERALRCLPSGAREVLVLYDIEGYRHAEIARLLGIAPGTSKAQLHRARQLLREALDR